MENKYKISELKHLIMTKNHLNFAFNRFYLQFEFKSLSEKKILKIMLANH